MRAGSPRRSKAFMEALRSCGLAARSDQSIYGGLEAVRAASPQAIKSVCGGLETGRAGSPHRSKAFMETLSPCGLAARSDQKRSWRP